MRLRGGCPPERLEVEVTGIGSRGEGVGRLPDGRVVFLPRTAPGDRVRVELVAGGARWARGRAVDLLRGSPDRRDPPCPVYARCGGCALQHLRYDAQLDLRRTTVLETLRRIGGRTELPEPVVHAAPSEFGYRNRVTFTLRRGHEGSVVAGFHALEAPDRIVDTGVDCLLPEPAIAKAWAAMRGSWGAGARALPAGDELRLLLRASEAGEVLLLVIGGVGGWDAEAWMARIPGLVSIWSLDPGDPAGPQHLAGRRTLRERWAGETVEVGPTAFLQVHRSLAPLLQARVTRAMGEVAGLRVLDAYCGTGDHGRRAAEVGALAVGIEMDPDAVRTARAAAGPGFRVLKGRVEDRIDEALPADLILLNPPRAGVAPEVLDRIVATPVRRIVYVSCDPATLARDLGRLGAGFRLVGLELFDLFPQTANVETLAVLQRGEG